MLYESYDTRNIFNSFLNNKLNGFYFYFLNY